jgi:hypothetical protein
MIAKGWVNVKEGRMPLTGFHPNKKFSPSPREAQSTATAMPTVNVEAERLYKDIGKKFTIPEFEELCFEFGIELDDVTSEKEMAEREMGEQKVAQAASALSESTIFKIDVSANRYDLLCPEGLALALKIFMGKEKVPQYKSISPSHLETITVKAEVRCIGRVVFRVWVTHLQHPMLF